MKLKRAGLRLEALAFLSSGRGDDSWASKPLQQLPGTFVSEFSVTTLGASIEVGSLSRAGFSSTWTLESPQAEIPITTDKLQLKRAYELRQDAFKKTIKTSS